jgi:hypothetical protein
MKYLYILTVVLLVSCGTKKIVYTSAKEQANYEVFNFLIAQIETDTLRVDVECSGLHKGIQFEDITPERMDNVFTQEDMEAMQAQYLDSIPFIIDPSKLSVPKKVYLETGKYKNMHSFSFSEPLFSKDYTKVVVSFSYYCGVWCGHGGTYLLRKGKNGWEIVTVLSDWIS